MKRLGGYLLEFVYWLEVLYLFLTFLGLLAFAFNLIGLEEIRRAAAWPWKEILLYVLAALSLIASLHFLLLNLRFHRLRRMIRQESQGGPVLVSPGALRRLIREALAET
jgi:hypothetical protein